eukprot:532409-Pyramimonas_sp.AAC.1
MMSDALKIRSGLSIAPSLKSRYFCVYMFGKPFHRATPAFALTADEVAKLTERIQNGGTEVRPGEVVGW